VDRTWQCSACSQRKLFEPFDSAEAATLPSNARLLPDKVLRNLGITPIEDSFGSNAMLELKPGAALHDEDFILTITSSSEEGFTRVLRVPSDEVLGVSCRSFGSGSELTFEVFLGYVSLKLQFAASVDARRWAQRVLRASTPEAKRRAMVRRDALLNKNLWALYFFFIPLDRHTDFNCGAY
jgi:hypothetical protein